MASAPPAPWAAAVLAGVLAVSQARSQQVTIIHTFTGGPADGAGIQAGDVIVSLNGRTISSTDQFIALAQQFRPVRRDDRATFGDRFTFDVTSESLPGVTRHFTSFTAAAEEAGLSRIYAGQHFRTDHNAGKLLGQQVAESVIDTMLLPR